MSYALYASGIIIDCEFVGFKRVTSIKVTNREIYINVDSAHVSNSCFAVKEKDLKDGEDLARAFMNIVDAYDLFMAPYKRGEAL